MAAANSQVLEAVQLNEAERDIHVGDPDAVADQASFRDCWSVRGGPAAVVPTQDFREGTVLELGSLEDSSRPQVVRHLQWQSNEEVAQSEEIE